MTTMPDTLTDEQIEAMSRMPDTLSDEDMAAMSAPSSPPDTSLFQTSPAKLKGNFGGRFTEQAPEAEQRPGWWERFGKTAVNDTMGFLGSISSPGSMSMNPDPRWQQMRLDAQQQAIQGKTEPVYDLPEGKGLYEKSADVMAGLGSFITEMALMPGGGATKSGQTLVRMGKFIAQGLLSQGAKLEVIKESGALGLGFEALGALPASSASKPFR